ncbi:MAG: hypothetical protein D6806_05345 [Deltaproteobacteria bacterium]|nr:MAG: hypothetical protein D6806_05345 [Deltaproteobacteria bacterium]
MADKVSKKELKQPDEFVSLATRTYKWIQSNWKLIVATGVAVVLAVVAVQVFQYVRQRKEGQASALFVEAKKVLDSPVSSAGEDQSKPGSYSSEKEKLSAALELMEKVVKDHDGTRTADLARYYIGEINMRLGNHEKARKAFERYLAEAGDDADFAPFAVEGLGLAYEAEGKLEEARKHFEKLTKPPFDLQPDRGLYHLARIAHQKGDEGKAKELLEKLLDEYPDSIFRTEAENRLELLKNPGLQIADAAKAEPERNDEDEKSGENQAANRVTAQRASEAIKKAGGKDEK